LTWVVLRGGGGHRLDRNSWDRQCPGPGRRKTSEEMSKINELGVDEQLTREVRKIAMMSKFDLTEQLDSQSTRRTVVATGVKLAYVAPIVAASFKVSALGASAAVTGGLICVDDDSPKQCPENQKIQFVCKGPLSNCPEDIWDDVEVLCTDDGQICVDKSDNTIVFDCTPVQCPNLAD
jgi:hypothetical protein